MEDNLKELKSEYKKKKKETNSFRKKKQIRHDYRKIKKLLKGSNKLIKKNNNLLKDSDEFWDKFDFQNFDDFKTNNENISIKEKSNKKIDETIK